MDQLDHSGNGFSFLCEFSMRLMLKRVYIVLIYKGGLNCTDFVNSFRGIKSIFVGLKSAACDVWDFPVTKTSQERGWGWVGMRLKTTKPQNMRKGVRAEKTHGQDRDF